MKLHTDRVDIERSGVGSETEFKIKTTAKAFDILSSGLYTDNVLAIVRELSCNAYDAHVAAGREDVPFEIHLPNRLEPFFSVKDFGTGLSDEQVMTLYTTYFDSTKTESNDFIGALGLGSKSPFSYTKSFEVISRYEGQRRVYSVFINEDGVPTIARMGNAIPTDEHNGLEVKITTNPDDAYKFESKTASALRWFPTKPKVVGVTHFTFNEPPKTQVQGDGWYMYQGDYYSSGKVLAIQGNVEYRVDLNQIDDIDDSVKRFLKRTNVIAFFDIGELEVAASREEIRYDKRTKAALAARIADVHRKALEDIETEAKQYTSLWDAIIKLNKKGNDILRDAGDFRKFVRASDVDILKQYADSKSRVTVDKPQGHDVYLYDWGRYGNGTNLSRKKGLTFEPATNTHVFVNDVKTGGIKRITNWLRANNGHRVIVITRHKTPQMTIDHKTMTAVVSNPKAMSEKQCKNALKKIIDELGNPTVHYVSTDTDVVKRVGSGARNKAIFRYNDYTSNDYRPDVVHFERPDDFDFEQGGLYYDLERAKTIKYRDTVLDWSPSQVEEKLSIVVDIINAYQGLSGDDQWDYKKDMFGVGSMDVKKFVKADNWFNVFDLLLEATDAYKASAEANGRWARTPDYLGLKEKVSQKSFVDKVCEMLDEHSAFRVVVESYREGWLAKHSVTLPHTHFMLQFDRFFGDKKLVELDEKPYIEEADVSGTYPLLAYLGDMDSYGYTSDKLVKTLEYIQLIDRS